MSDDFQQSPDGQQAASVFNIQRMYLKDASLELPNAPRIFLEQTPPDVEIALDVGAEPLAEGVWEVTVTSTVTAKIGDKVLFLVECKQAGIFQMTNIPVDQLEPILGIVCPGIVYPYLRANLSDLLSRTGLPPVTLNEINFEAFYQQRVQTRQLEQQAQLADGSPSLQ